VLAGYKRSTFGYNVNSLPTGAVRDVGDGRIRNSSVNVGDVTGTYVESTSGDVTNIESHPPTNSHPASANA
jgi:hypothetical protein